MHERINLEMLQKFYLHIGENVKVAMSEVENLHIFTDMITTTCFKERIYVNEIISLKHNYEAY
jgi:hypothetical protein